jgi:mannosyltransferase
MKRFEGYWLAGILLLAAILRSLGIATRGIIYDDAFSFFLSARSIPEIIRGTAADTMPPLYYFLLHFWEQASHQLWWLRLLSVLFSLGIVFVLYLLVSQLFDRKAGLWAAFFAAISPLQFYHAQDIRMYALLALFQLLYAWFFVRIWMKAGRRQSINWIGLVLSGSAAMYTHNLAIFFLVVPDLALLIKRDWRLLGKMLAAQVVIGITALPWLLLVPGQIAKIQRAFWTLPPGISQIIDAIAISVTDWPLNGIWLMVGLYLSLLIFIFVTLEIIRILWNLVKKKDKGISGIVLVSLTLFPPFLLFAASYIIRPVFVPRGFLASTLAYLAVAGTLVARKWLRPISLIVTIGLVSAAAIGLPHQVTNDNFPRSPFQEAGNFLSNHLKPGELVLHDNKLSFFPMKYFWPDLPQEFLPDEPGSPNDTYSPISQEAMELFPEPGLEQAVKGTQKVYFVVFEETIHEYQAAGLDHPLLKTLSTSFHQAGLYKFNDLDVILFER